MRHPCTLPFLGFCGWCDLAPLLREAYDLDALMAEAYPTLTQMAAESLPGPSSELPQRDRAKDVARGLADLARRQEAVSRETSKPLRKP